MKVVPTSTVAVELVHDECGTVSTSRETRKIVSQPNDRSWPQDFEVRLPYCERCGTTFGFADLIWRTK
jgi:hypothetical protein